MSLTFRIFGLIIACSVWQIEAAVARSLRGVSRIVASRSVIVVLLSVALSCSQLPVVVPLMAPTRASEARAAATTWSGVKPNCSNSTWYGALAP